MKSIFALILAGLVQIAIASPVAPRSVAHLKYDTRSEKVYMYRRDGSLHGVYSKRQFNDQFQSLQARDGGSSCNALSVDDAKKLPGWSKIEAYAKSTWGDGSYNLATNPKEYPDSPANACVDTAKVQLAAKGPPSCNNQTSNAQGTLTGTKGTVTLSQGSSSSISGSWTVTQTSTFMEGTSFSVGIEIPEGPSLGMEFQQSTTITNEQSKSFSTSANASNAISLNVDNPNGNSCTFTLETQTCSQDTTGSLPIVATGWVWFNYNDKRPALSDPKGDAHFKYAASIESVLTDKADRSSSIEFQGSINMVSNSGYGGKCQ
jgi:hypothetical protein